MFNRTATLTFILAETVFAVLPILRFSLPDVFFARCALLLAPLAWFFGMRYRRPGLLLVVTPVAWFVGMAPHLTAVAGVAEVLLAMTTLLTYLAVHCHGSETQRRNADEMRDEPRAVTTEWEPVASGHQRLGTAAHYPAVLVLVSFALSPIFAIDWLLTSEAYAVWQTQLARVQSAMILVFGLQGMLILEQLLTCITPFKMGHARIPTMPGSAEDGGRRIIDRQTKSSRGWAGIGLFVLSMPCSFCAFNRVFDGRYFNAMALLIGCIAALALGSKLLNDYALAIARPSLNEEESWSG